MNYISVDRHVSSDPVRVLYLTVHQAVLKRFVRVGLKLCRVPSWRG